MKVIIAGGSGLIGRALSQSLSGDGYEVIILSRFPQKVRDLPSGSSAVAWDARSSQGWGQLVDGADAIVNLAGASIKGDGFLPSRWTRRRKNLIRDSRLLAGRAILEAVRATEQKPQVLIQSSAIGYYGPRADERLSEDAEAGDDFLARTCAEWEASTREVESMGLRHIVVRTGLLLTNKGGAFPLLALPFRLFLGNTFGHGNQYYSWIHSADHTAALRFMIESKKAKGIYNLTAPQPVKNREFAQTMGRVMRRPSFFPVPAFALQSVLGEVSSVVLDGQRVLPQRLQSEGFSFLYPELEPALRELLDK